jgi:biopolymer transport protein ExbD
MSFLRRGFLKPANRPDNLYCRIDPSPVAAIFFAFLSMFMGEIGVPDTPRRISVDLALAPHASEFPGALREDAIVIVLTRDAMVFFRDLRIHSEQVPEQIQKAISEGAYQTIFLKADARAKYGDVKAIVNLIRSSGAQHVVLLVESPSPPASNLRRVQNSLLSR